MDKASCNVANPSQDTCAARCARSRCLQPRGHCPQPPTCLWPPVVLSKEEWAAHQQECKLLSGDEGWAGERKPQHWLPRQSATACLLNRGFKVLDIAKWAENRKDRFLNCFSTAAVRTEYCSLGPSQPYSSSLFFERLFTD